MSKPEAAFWQFTALIKSTAYSSKATTERERGSILPDHISCFTYASSSRDCVLPISLSQLMDPWVQVKLGYQLARPKLSAPDRKRNGFRKRGSCSLPTKLGLKPLEHTCVRESCACERACVPYCWPNKLALVNHSACLACCFARASLVPD